jgi:hypothetical protein
MHNRQIIPTHFMGCSREIRQSRLPCTSCHVGSTAKLFSRKRASGRGLSTDQFDARHPAAVDAETAWRFVSSQTAIQAGSTGHTRTYHLHISSCAGL